MPGSTCGQFIINFRMEIVLGLFMDIKSWSSGDSWWSSRHSSCRMDLNLFRARRAEPGWDALAVWDSTKAFQKVHERHGGWFLRVLAIVNHQICLEKRNIHHMHTQWVQFVAHIDKWTIKHGIVAFDYHSSQSVLKASSFKRRLLEVVPIEVEKGGQPFQ